MREMDFSQKNLFRRWLGVKSIWRDLEGETKRFVKRRLERAMEVELTAQVGCGRYKRSGKRRNYRNGSYVRDLLTSYGWLGGLSIPRLRRGIFKSSVFERYRPRLCSDKPCRVRSPRS